MLVDNDNGGGGDADVYDDDGDKNKCQVHGLSSENIYRRFFLMAGC